MNDRIESLLNERQTKKDIADRERLAFEQIDDRAKAALESLELTEGACRIGRFRITRTYVAARTVQPFETKASNRIRISTIEG